MFIIFRLNNTQCFDPNLHQISIIITLCRVMTYLFAFDGIKDGHRAFNRDNSDDGDRSCV